MAVRKFGWGGPEVGNPGDPPVLIQVEEAHSGVAVTGIRELHPVRRVAAFPDDPLDVEMVGVCPVLYVGVAAHRA